MPILTVFSDACGGGRLAYRIAGVILERGGSGAKWIITDGQLEGALAYRLAKAKRTTNLVSPVHDRDAQYVTNLVRTVERDYPKCATLRLAAKLGVMPFLEELPFAETNDMALVSVWGARVWDAESMERVKSLMASSYRARRDPLRPYVERRLAGLSGRNDEVRRRAAMQILGAHLGNLSQMGQGGSNHVARINAVVDEIAADAQCGDITKLKAHARLLVRNDRMNPLGNAILGTFAAMEGDDEIAVLCLRRAVGRGNVPILVWNDYAESLRRVEKYDEATQVIRQAIVKNPNEWRLYETLTDILFSSGEPVEQVEKALVQAETLSSSEPANQKPTLVFLRGAVSWRKGDRALARMQFRRLSNSPISSYLKMRISTFR